MEISDEELEELVMLFLVAINDSHIVSDLSHDREEIDAYKEHRRDLQKWMRRFKAVQSAPKVTE